ncbi:uncharacterized protein LOC113855557 [Abrus precatorius]|uniref:Uncharacterized protein LOC113855557 n=1 Tax=Abrus precatorius TaxID=3816 RepID=A0A8B8KGQ1_ABRPR|nr:uncharacterized protein LOC113855557 [Abrus precatorius]
MAFFPIKARVIVLVLLAILFPPFIHQAKNLVGADYQLIRTLCHYSETPKTCMRCVQSAKDCGKANSLRIATIIVECINDRANTLAQKMTTLALETSDQSLKLLYQRCAQDYGPQIAKKELISATQALENQNYATAESNVLTALNLDLTCHFDLKSYQKKVPSYVFKVMKTYEELSEAVSRIIEKL